MIMQTEKMKDIMKIEIREIKKVDMKYLVEDLVEDMAEDMTEDMMDHRVEMKDLENKNPIW